MVGYSRATRISAERGRSLLRIAIAVICLLGLAAPGAARPAIAPTASTPIFEKLVMDRIQAFGRGDVRAYTSLISNDFVHISDSGVRRTASQMMDYVALGRAPGNTYSVRDLTWHVHGNLAVIDCEVILFEAGGRNRQREVNIFAARNGRWVYLLHQETMVQEQPAAAAIDPNKFLDFVGEYRLETGGTDIFSTRGGALYGQGSPSDERTLLIPIAADAFVVAGDPSVTIFERDPQRKVIGYVLHAGNGRLLRAKKIK